MITIGNTEITKAYLGNTNVSKMYLGEDLVFGKEKTQVLSYWWSGEDSLVNNKWIDRISEKEWTASGNITKEDDNSYIVGSSKYSKYFTMNGNTQGINLGDEWKIIVTVEYEEYFSRSGNWLIDFGSVGSVNHAFGFFITNNKYFNDNYKGFSNSDTNTYGVSGNTSKLVIPTNTVITLEYGCRKQSSNSYIQYASYNNTEVVAPNAHQMTEFNSNFNNPNFYIGRSLSTSYVGAGRIYDIKIYTYSN